MTLEQNNKYIIGRNSFSTARLNLQHFWTQQQCGYLIHPDIPLAENAKIADVGTGTGIWPISVSQLHPPSIQIDGFDISNAQFPPLEWLPANVKLDKLNILEPIPKHLIGQYDVVHIRYFGLLMRNGNHSRVLENPISLLNDGGYLQWLEVDIASQTVVSSRPEVVTTMSHSLCEDGLEFLATAGLSYDWLHELPSSFLNAGLAEVKEAKPKPKPEFRSIFGFVAISGWEEYSYEVLDIDGPNEIFGTGIELRDRIKDVRAEFQKGVSFEQQLHVVIGKRSP